MDTTRADRPSDLRPERSAVLATKLHVPRPREGVLVRAQLLDRLDRGAAGRLTVISAPAGFGKTTLLAQWSRQAGRRVAWFSLDAGDDDVRRFCQYLGAALDPVRPGLQERVAALLSAPEPPPVGAVLTEIVNGLDDAAEEVVLVLDDYHEVEAPAVHRVVATLLERLPAGAHLVIAGRSDPPLPLARLRAGGALTELREVDLRLTTQESVDLLRRVTGLPLAPEQLAALVTRTEGWAAGLQLAGLSLAGHPDPAGFVRSFTGTHRYVLDYLTEEVLARQPEELVGFLLETSVLERLSGPLCDAVLDRDDSQEVLVRIEQARLFLTPLDDVRGWWRYHGLFADLLRTQLRRDRPGREAELHRAAAAWFERHGLEDDAIRHALAAGDHARAARLIEESFDDALSRAEDAALARRLAELPRSVVRSRSRLCLVQAYWALIDGRLRDATSHLDDAERALASGTDASELLELDPASSLVGNVPAAVAVLRARLARLRGDPEGTIAFGEQARAHLREADRALRWLLDWYLRVADWLLGRLPAAEQGMTEVVAAQGLGGRWRLARWPRYELGEIQLVGGRLGAALRTFTEALETSSDQGGLPQDGVAHAGVAEVLYRRDQLEAALAHALDGVRLCRRLSYALPLAIALTVLARVQYALGDRNAATAAVEEAQRLVSASEVTSLINPVPVAAALMRLREGRVAEAAGWSAARGLRADDPPTYLREPDHLVLARVLLTQGDAGPALALLDGLHALATRQERVGSLIEIQVLRSLALRASGDAAASVAALADAVTLGAPEGHVRVFVDEGEPMARVFRALAADQPSVRRLNAAPVTRTHLAALLEAFDRAGHPVLPRARAGGASAAGLVTPLSARELEVLRLLAAGRTNQGIADELVVTLDTVKRHVTHVLEKLGADNRTHAVARARELGILDDATRP